MHSVAGVPPFQSLLKRLWEQQWLRQPKREIMNRIVQLAVAECRAAFGKETYLANEDRRVLEQVIFPYFLDDDTYRNVLFVGCSWCTRGYNKRFQARKNYCTIDAWPWKRKYGGKRHIVDDLQRLDRHFAPGALDLILCNGVFGYGLNDKQDVEQAFRACYEVLRERGVLVVGWNDTVEKSPFPLSECGSLRAFQPFVFPPLATAEYLTDTPYRYTYTFFSRPAASDRAPVARNTPRSEAA